MPQRTPHAPQLVVVPSTVSQPSAVLPLQSPKPGLHVIPHPEPAQRPLALVAPRHVVTVAAVPVALHTLRVVPDAHVAVPGEHTVAAAHAPPEHVCPLAQAVSTNPRPSAAHTCDDVADAQESAPGEQIHGAQTPARQVVRAPQPAAV